MAKTFYSSSEGYTATVTIADTCSVTATGIQFSVTPPSTVTYALNGDISGESRFLVYDAGLGNPGFLRSNVSGVKAASSSSTCKSTGWQGSLVGNTGDYFTSSNSTAIRVQIPIKASYVWRYQQANTSFPPTWYGNGTAVTLSTLTVTLNAPPIIDATHNTASMSYSPANIGYYAGVTTVSASVSNLSAQYGGSISSVVLKIGDQTSTPISAAGTVSIALMASGTFIPEVIFTDSRGQTSTRYLDQITVSPYECAVSNLVISRIRNTDYARDDEGTNAVLQARFVHTHFTGSTLSPPAVSISGIATPNITWYQNWNSNSGFSNQVSDWSTLQGDVTLYAKIANTLDKDSSYTITVTPRTTLITSGGASMEVNLAQSFYLLVGRPGGHGLGIGMKPSSDALHVDMDAYFYKDVFFQSMAGTVQMFAGAITQTIDNGIATVTGAPAGWLLCDGSEVSRTTYATLFHVIETTYGSGDDSTTFNLPDLRDRFPVGAGSTYTNNQKGGSAQAVVVTHTHNIASSGGHTHTISAKYADNRLASGTARSQYYASGTSTNTSMATIASNTGAHTHTTAAPTGATAASNTANLPPYIGINFIICTGTSS